MNMQIITATMCFSGMLVTSVSLGCFETGHWATVQLDWCGS